MHDCAANLTLPPKAHGAFQEMFSLWMLNCPRSQNCLIQLSVESVTVCLLCAALVFIHDAVAPLLVLYNRLVVMFTTIPFLLK
jgi:hypothetical protein